MQRKNRLRARRAVLGAVAAATASLALCGVAQADGYGLVPESFSADLSTLQAGAHPDLHIRFSLKRNPDSSPVGGGTKEFQMVLPKGLIGAVAAIPTCPLANAISYEHPCPRESMVGRVTPTALLGETFPLSLPQGIFNINPYPGEPAAFAFLASVPVRVDTFVRPDGDYGITATGKNLTEAAALLGVDMTFWGVPADHSGPGADADQNSLRPIGGPNPNQPRIPFLTNPTECSGKPLTSSIVVRPWANPTEAGTGEYAMGAITGCDQLAFEPTVEAKPTTDLADAPTGLEFNLHFPQHNKVIGGNEVQTLTVDANEGQFRLGFGAETTGDLAWNAGHSEVQSALEGLAAIGAGNVSVFGGPTLNTDLVYENHPWVVTFKGTLANTDVEELTSENGTEPLQVKASTTVPGSLTVATSSNGTLPASIGEESATAELRDAVVTLPEGMTVNPPSADGRSACSLAQLGMSASGQPNGNPVACPDASKLGTVEAVSPALDHPLAGSLYLAAQNENPFGSLLALYLVIDDPLSGVLVKLAGKVEPDPQTGQLTVSFRNNPQLPVEDLKLSLFKGPRAALKTPTACGEHTTTSTLTPWSSPEGADANPSSSFVLTKGPSGGACLAAGAGAPNQPTFSAGTLNPTAKAFSPFVLRLTRSDGTQPLKSIDTTLPKGLLGRLAGTPYCSDAALATTAAKGGRSEQASPSCPAASQVGTVNVGAGAGSDPLYVGGKAYLAGPYKGAPLSLAIVTPAVAGPFDLGTVVVRTALNVDPASTQIHAVSDPIPTILQGIPLDVRSIALNIDKPNFTLNPTNCDPAQILGGAISVFDQTALLSSPFQVGDCARLKFDPSLKFSLKGQTKRTGNPALTAVLKAPEGQANIAKTAVLLPATEFIDNAHINNPCTRVQFNANACPKKSILGTATAYSPLLDQPLSGPVYFRSNGGERELPDMVVDLGGQIHVTLVGFIDSVGKQGSEKRRLRIRFQTIPDAPVSKFVLKLYGGKRGLIENSVNLCKQPGQARVQIEAQNANTTSFDTPFAANCGKVGKKSKGSSGRHHKAG